MKNLLLIFFFAQLLILPAGLMTASAMPQVATEANLEITQTQTAPKQGFFQKIVKSVKDNAVEFGVAFIFGMFAKGGWTLLAKKIANKAAIISREVGETFLSGSLFLNTLDQSIRDDGSLKENSVKELLAAGKEVITEAKDVIISIKPKPV